MLDVGRVVAPVAALSHPYRAQVAGVLPTANCRDVDPEEIGNFADAK
jgi:hypothetical protein